MEKENPDLMPSHQMPPAVLARNFKEWNLHSCECLPFGPEFVCQQVRHPSQAAGFNSSFYWNKTQHCCVIRVQAVHNPTEPSMSC
jgi:hypothetical protein